ncbi:hypothetical protein [Treponema sp. R80B11-R83G3]
MSFGWELKNNQRVKTQDVQRFTGQDSNGTEHYKTTRGVDFIKLTFERDPERKNYAELKALEEQYYAPLPDFYARPPKDIESKPDKPSIIGGILSVISFIFGVICLVSTVYYISSGKGESFIILLFTALFLWLGISGIRRRILFSSSLKTWEAAYEYWKTENEKYKTICAAQNKALSEAQEKRAEILEKARALV